MGLSEEEIVQIILEGVTPQERSRLGFAERPRCYADLDRLCVMSRAIQANDELRGPRVVRQDEGRKDQRRAGQSHSRYVQSASVGGGQSRFVCYNCSKPGHVARNCPEGRARPTPSPRVPYPKTGQTGEDRLEVIFPSQS